MTTNEILTASENEMDRFCLFPIKYMDMYRMYEKHQSLFWTPEEVDIASDINDFKSLTTTEQRFIEHILGFFASSDNIVIERLFSSLATDITVPEARLFYSFQLAMEAVHSVTYNLLIETLVKDEKRKQELFRAVETLPCVAKKAQWAINHIETKLNRPDALARKIFSFGIVEGLFFSGSFCALFWLKNRGLCVSGLGLSNEFIARDEGLHVEFAILLYKYVVNRLSEEDAFAIMRQAVDIEDEFITESISCSMIGMKCLDMKQYIRYVADRLLQSFGYNILYEATNPFPWMMKNSIEGKSNFFEKRVSDYRRPTASPSSFTTVDDLENDEDF